MKWYQKKNRDELNEWIVPDVDKRSDLRKEIV